MKHFNIAALAHMMGPGVLAAALKSRRPTAKHLLGGHEPKDPDTESRQVRRARARANPKGLALVSPSATLSDMLRRYRHYNRSKYMPHIGKKEMARYG